jgi:hypothetical protein
MNAVTCPAGGTLVELFRHGLERVCDDVGAAQAGYETAWGMMHAQGPEDAHQRRGLTPASVGTFAVRRHGARRRSGTGSIASVSSILSLIW